jgi:hypothetical protein
LLIFKTSAVQDYKELVAEAERRRVATSHSYPQMTFMAYMAQHASDSKLVQMRLRLLKLLQRSRMYDPSTVLDRLNTSEQLQLEHAILYGKVRKNDYTNAIL